MTGPEKIKVSDSHRNDVSPLTEDLNYRSSCDVRAHVVYGNDILIDTS